MGHLLSKNGNRLKKKRKAQKKRRRRNCFLQGPCMLCFIVHSNSDDEHLEGSAGRLAEHYSALSSPEDCARFLLSPPELAIWEGQGKSLLSAVPAKLLGPPVLLCGAVPATDYSEMVCKRKCGELRPSGPCKQPRCAFQEAASSSGVGDAPATTTHCHLPLCPLPSSSSSSASGPGAGLQAEVGQGGGDTGNTLAAFQSSSPSCQQDSSDPPGDSRDSELAEAPSINHLPSSILLKVFSHLSVKERCLAVSLVCKYWRDLCLDFQFWKQIDLSGLQQVTDDLLEKIAARRQNVMEINISDCRKVQDDGVRALVQHCPGLLRYTAYRCKQLSDASLAAVAAHCPLLQKVHVGNQDKLTDGALRKLGESCLELRDVHLGQCYSISDEGMVALARGCPKLQKIYMQENKLASVTQEHSELNNGVERGDSDSAARASSAVTPARPAVRCL